MPALRTLLLLLATTLSWGCATQAANSITLAPEVSSQIEVMNSGLHSECEITGGGAVLYEDKILSTFVVLHSHLDVKQTLEGRWTFEDAQGYPMKGGVAWKSLFVNAREEQKVEGKAPGPMAARGKFELRYHSGRTD